MSMIDFYVKFSEEGTPGNPTDDCGWRENIVVLTCLVGVGCMVVFSIKASEKQVERPESIVAGVIAGIFFIGMAIFCCAQRNEEKTSLLFFGRGNGAKQSDVSGVVMASQATPTPNPSPAGDRV